MVRVRIFISVNTLFKSQVWGHCNSNIQRKIHAKYNGFNENIFQFTTNLCSVDNSTVASVVELLYLDFLLIKLGKKQIFSRNIFLHNAVHSLQDPHVFFHGMLSWYVTCGHIPKNLEFYISMLKKILFDSIQLLKRLKAF